MFMTIHCKRNLHFPPMKNEQEILKLAMTKMTENPLFPLQINNDDEIRLNWEIGIQSFLKQTLEVIGQIPFQNI